MQTYNVSRLPSVIKIGWDGENLWRPQAFDCSVLLANHPNGVITLWLLPNGETDAIPVALERDGNMAVWTPTSAELVVKMGQLQLMCVDGVAVGKSAVVYYQRSDSLVSGEASETPSWAVQVVEDVNEAASHYPQIIDGFWWVWDVTNGIWVNTEVSASGGEISPSDIADAVEDYLDEHPITVTETDPTVPAWAKAAQKPTYTAAEVGALPDTYTPPVESVNGKTGAVTITAAELGALTQHQSLAAYRTSAAQDTIDVAQDTAIAAKYTKPSGGIPKSDLAEDVKASLGKADTALQEHQSLAGYATETWVQDQGYLTQHQDISGKADKIPRITKAATDTVATIEPNKLYVFPEMASLAITLAAISDDSIVNEYHFIFESGATATTLTLPSTVNQPDGFTVEANMIYEVSILENCMTAMSWEVTA